MSVFYNESPCTYIDCVYSGAGADPGQNSKRGTIFKTHNTNTTKLKLWVFRGFEVVDFYFAINLKKCIQNNTF